MARYTSIQISPDGEDYITDYDCATVQEVWDLVNDQGSRWFFYPLAFVIRADTWSGAGTRTQVMDRHIAPGGAPDGFNLDGCKVSTVMRLAPEMWEMIST